MVDPSHATSGQPDTARKRKRPFYKRLPRTIKACQACRDRKIKCDVSSDTNEGCSACRSAYIVCDYSDRSTLPEAASPGQVSPSQDGAHAPVHPSRRSESTVVRPPHRPRRRSSFTTVARKELFPLDEKGNVRYLGPAAGYSFVASVGAYFTLMGYESISLPPRWRWADPPSLTPPNLDMTLPPREIATDLLESYRASFHKWFPLLPWPSVEVKISKLYAFVPGSSADLASIRLSFCLVNVVFAIGTQFGKSSSLLANASSSRMTYGKEFFERAMHAYQWCPKNYTYDDIILLVLMACYLEGAGCAGPCYMISGAAFHIAADMGLDKIAPPGLFTTSEDRFRKRLFRGCFLLDSRIALAFGRPPFFSHTDYNTSKLLRPAEDDEDILLGGHACKGEMQSQKLLLIMAIFSREVDMIIKDETSDDLLVQLTEADKRLEVAWRLLPKDYQTLDPEQPLDPALLNILLYLQHIRLVLHRYFSDPSVTAEVRTHCLRRCAEICVRSSQIVHRTTSWPDEGRRFCEVATDVVQNHSYRCSILLLIAIFNNRHDLPPADTNVQVEHVRTMVSMLQKLGSSGRSHAARSLTEVLQLAENIALQDPEIASLKVDQQCASDISIFRDSPVQVTFAQGGTPVDPYSFLDWTHEPMQGFQGNTGLENISLGAMNQ